MFWEDFYFLDRGRHVRYRYISMMWLRHDLIIRQIYFDGGRGSGFWIFWTGAVSGQVWVVHPISMAASLCLKFILGGNTILEWQTYIVDLNNGSLLILIKFLLLLILPKYLISYNKYHSAYHDFIFCWHHCYSRIVQLTPLFQWDLPISIVSTLYTFIFR